MPVFGAREPCFRKEHLEYLRHHHHQPARDRPGQGGGATGKAQEAAQAAQEKAQEAKGKRAIAFATEVDTRSTQAGEQAETVAQDVRSVGEHLRSEGKDKPAELADKAAERVAEISDYLKRSDGDAILRDAERARARQAVGRHGRRASRSASPPRAS